MVTKEKDEDKAFDKVFYTIRYSHYTSLFNYVVGLQHIKNYNLSISPNH